MIELVVEENDLCPSINILFLIEKLRFTTKMSRVRFHAIRALESKANVFYWGPGWDDYDEGITLHENIKKLKKTINFILGYKVENIKGIAAVPILKCITYNEMDDFKETINEINCIKPDLIICHHKNDMINYQKKMFKELSCFTNFIHIPHCADKSIYQEKKTEKNIDILLCGIIGVKHTFYQRLHSLLRIASTPIQLFIYLINKQSYLAFNLLKLKGHISILFYGYSKRIYPLRQKYREVLKMIPKKYKTLEYKHPGYTKNDAHTDIYAKEFADVINQSKICLTCTSKYKYRLAKMVEIPMCGSALASDIPDQNQETFKEIMIVIDRMMSNKAIANKLIYYLENDCQLEDIRQKGYKWSQQYGQEYYAQQLLAEFKKVSLKVLKIYVHSEDLQSIKNKWICDVLKSDFLQYSQTKIVGSPREADIIWLLAPWAHSKIDEQYLKNKFVITTIHHIDESKYPKKKEYFNYIDSITNRYHTICDKSKVALKKRTNKEVITANFWIDETTFFNIPNKQGLRAIYSIPENAFVVGSFQKDSEGKNLKLPKLSKGPDIFIKIIEDLKNKKQNIHVVLTGWRRNYIIKELERIKVSYSFFEMVNSKELNELYNCLDLYIVSSRVEGGPRSIIECGLAKAPIISTDVGISELILNKESIFDVNDFITYRSATPNVNYSYKKAKEYTISNYMQSFIKNVFFEIKQH